MIITHHDQGGDAWLRSRLGVLTASVAAKVVTSGGKKSASARDLMLKLAAQRITGKIEDGFKSDWMTRGNEVEHRGREVFEFLLDAEVHETGLIFSEKMEWVGCSPDGLAEASGQLVGLEIKSPSPHVHLSYLMANKVPAIYHPQIQFSMWATGLEKWFFVSNHDDFRPLIIECEIDNDYVAALERYIPDFLSGVEKMVRDYGD